MKNIYKITFLAITLLVSSCGGNDKKNIEDQSEPIAVKVSKVQTNKNTPFVTASGKIEAQNSANLSTRMMGYVNKIHVKVGDKVMKGQLLISINNSDLQAKSARISATVTEAKAAFNNSEKEYNRFKNLFEDDSASQKELDDITTHYEMSKARLEAANQMKNEINAQFSYVNIKAPFSGVVTSKFINNGDMANSGMPLMAIESPDNFEVIAMVPESEIFKIKAQTKVNVLVKSLGETVKGEVVEISTSAKNTGGQYLVKIRLDKTDKQILSGMFASVQFPVEKTEATIKAILVSTEALVHKGQLTGVYTVSQSNTALLRWLRLGRTIGNQVEILSGINLDESYIVSAEGKLYNGVKIVIQ